MELYEVVKKLVGEIDPIGETNEDDRRFENLKEMTELVDKLLSDIDDVGMLNKDSHEHSVKRASNFAIKFFNKIGIEE